jgi:uncharacterized protein (DUF2164 family)
MELNLSNKQKDHLSQKVIQMYFEDFDEEISEFRAEQILDAFVTKIGPSIYNAAVEDVKQFMLTQLEDMGAIYHKK